MQQQKEITVTILERPYTLVGDFDTQKLHEASKKIDSIMKELQSANPASSPVKIAVLAALKMAFQMDRVKQECTNCIKMIERERAELQQLLTTEAPLSH